MPEVETMPPLPAPPRGLSDRLAGDDPASTFIARTPLAWTTGVRLRAGRIALGGSPWQVHHLPPEVRAFARRLFAANRTGLTAATPAEQRAAVYLLDRGIADPLPIADRPVTDVEVVVPVYRDVEALDTCLASLAAEGLPVTVVDDASPRPDAARIRRIAAAHGARLLVHRRNGGAGAARNTGFAATTAPFVAFLDSDAIASPDWIARLRPLFDDPRVGAVGPRVRPDVRGASSIDLYEETRSELDMGPEPSLVMIGAAVGWLPSASVIVRRAAVGDPPFEPGLRVGEDVDLFWRMHEAGWAVRYAPDVVNRHRVRTSLREFSGRRAGYGGSAADLEQRHPGTLIPARPSLAGLGVVAALSLKRPWIAAAIAAYEFARQRRMLGPGAPTSVAVEMTGRSLWSDAFWMGHLLRRDWWPVGWAVLAATPRSRLARGVAATMMWEPVRDHLLRPTRLGPVRSLALRLLDDASYGTGVIRGAIRKRVPNVVTPRVRIPTWPTSPHPHPSEFDAPAKEHPDA